MDFKKKLRPQNPEKKLEKKDILKNLWRVEKVIDAFESKIFLVKIEGTGFSGKVSDHSNLKILTPKQTL